ARNSSNAAMMRTLAARTAAATPRARHPRMREIVACLANRVASAFRRKAAAVVRILNAARCLPAKAGSHTTSGPHNLWALKPHLQAKSNRARRTGRDLFGVHHQLDGHR